MAGHAGRVPALHTKLLHPAPLCSPQPLQAGNSSQRPLGYPSAPGSRSQPHLSQAAASTRGLPLPCRPQAPLAAPGLQPSRWGPGPCPAPARATRLLPKEPVLLRDRDGWCSPVISH